MTYGVSPALVQPKHPLIEHKCGLLPAVHVKLGLFVVFHIEKPVGLLPAYGGKEIAFIT